jgi:hypothetical protein
MAGQVLRMNGNGRLTAPPQVEVALVTNSVDGMVSGGWMSGPTTGGTPLVKVSPDSGMRMRDERGISCVGRRAVAGTQRYGIAPVTAIHVYMAQVLSVSQEAAAGT